MFTISSTDIHTQKENGSDETRHVVTHTYSHEV